MTPSPRLPRTARGGAFLFLILLCTAACSDVAPTDGKIRDARSSSAQGVAMLPAPGVGSDGLQRIQIVGPDSANVISLARVIASALRSQPRVANADSNLVAVPLDVGGMQFALNVSYEFRGPRKLADKVRTTVAADAKPPSGYKVLANASAR